MHASLIDALVKAFGCESQLAFADLLKVDKRRVSDWKRVGLPWRRRFEIQNLAADRGVKLPEEFHDTRKKAA